MDEIKIKLTCDGGTLLCFYLNEDGCLDIDKNNHQDIATLTKENIEDLRTFLNSL